MFNDLFGIHRYLRLLEKGDEMGVRTLNTERIVFHATYLGSLHILKAISRYDYGLTQFHVMK